VRDALTRGIGLIDRDRRVRPSARVQREALAAR
jgi:hypothetical protein